MNTPNNPQTPQPLAPIGAPITSVVGVEAHDAPDSRQALQQSPNQLPNTPSVPGSAGTAAAISERIKALGIKLEWIKSYVQFIHALAVPVGQGTIIAAGFGEDPSQTDLKTGKLGLSLKPKLIHASIGNVQGTLEGLVELITRSHYNIYMPLAVFRPDLPSGSKGFERDVIACLGIVADFDDPEASRWAERLPIPPNYVLETSAGRFQAFYLFDKPELLQAAKPVAERLKAFAECDHGTSDMSHVWRVPGALNWPNAKKVAEGRSPQPQLVTGVKGDNSRTSLQALSDMLPQAAPTAKLNKAKRQTAAEEPRHPDKTEVRLDLRPDLLTLARVWSLPPDLRDEIEQPATGDRSTALFRVIKRLFEEGLDDTTIHQIIRAHPKGVGAKYVGRDDLDKEIARVKSKTTTLSSNNPLLSMIAEMNREYAVVDDNGKTFVVYRREDTELNREYVVRASYQAFRDFHLNARTPVTDAASGRVKLLANADVWLSHPQRRTYKGGLRFLPGVDEVLSDVYNLWTGWGVDPHPGDWSKMKTHIRTVLCSGVPEHFEYVMNWLAKAVQEPSVAGEVALVLRGGRGAGKGMFARAIGALFGQHFLHLSDARHLTGNFNAHLRDACLVFADEAFYAGDKQHEGQLKRLVTEPTLMIEAKYANAVPVRNCLHLIVASNDDWVVPAGTDERRFFVLDVSPSRKGDFAYFRSLADELENGGASAMLYELLQRDLSSFNVRDVPQTAGLLDQKVRSLHGFEAWWYEVLAEGRCPGTANDDNPFLADADDWATSIRVDRNLMFENYLAFSKARKEYRAENKSQLGKFLQKHVPGIDAERPRQAGNGRRDRFYRLPPLGECRAEFEKAIGTVDWEDG